MNRLSATRVRYLVMPNMIFSLIMVSAPAYAYDYAAAIDLSGFKISGDERAGWVSYDYSNPNGDPTINKGHKDSEGFYVVPKLSLQTPSYRGFDAKITGAGATDFGLNDPAKESRNFVFDPTENKSFAILQELYIEYDNEHHNALVGRKEIITPMIDYDDYYMLGNSFAIARYTNKSFDDTELHIGFFYQMAGVWDSGANGTEFNSMSQASFVPQINKDQAGDKGVYYAAADYSDGRHHGQLWEYYAEDLYNILFAQYNLTTGGKKYNEDFGLQFINWSQVGKLEASSTEIDYSLYSVKYDGNFESGFSFATGISKYTDGPGQDATLGAWGGYPYFANGMIFHFFEAGSLQNASSYKVQGGYNLKQAGFKNATIKLRYTYYNLDPDHSYATDGQPQDYMKLTGVQLSYSFMKTGYFTGTFEYSDLDNEEPSKALRLIGGYRF
jgi:hypothetical protein